ncbi:cell cycle checkpoint protein RAD17 [Spatholobus suberectus]|nr:cell cycle checkpoint protein RAD17 [Spatholobus suberectus]
MAVGLDGSGGCTVVEVWRGWRRASDRLEAWWLRCGGGGSTKVVDTQQGRRRGSNTSIVHNFYPTCLGRAPLETTIEEAISRIERTSTNAFSVTKSRGRSQFPQHFITLTRGIQIVVLHVAMAYEDEDGSSGSGEDVNLMDGHKRHPVVVASGSSGRKRSRKANGDAIVDAMLEIAAASKMRATAILKNEDRFSISKCIKVLDELQGVDERLYFLALDLFENNSCAREIFISLKGEKRLPWLQCKLSVSSG